MRITKLIFLVLIVLGVSGIAACGKEEGKDGAAGEDGKDGISGKAGADGKDGKDLQEGQNEASEPVLAVNEWQDPSTGKIWLIGGKVIWDVAQTACKSPYKTPDQTTLLEGAQHGLFVVSKSLGGPESGWSTDVAVSGNGVGVNSSSLQVYIDFQPKGTGMGLFCVRTK